MNTENLSFLKPVELAYQLDDSIGRLSEDQNSGSATQHAVAMAEAFTDYPELLRGETVVNVGQGLESWAS